MPQSEDVPVVPARKNLKPVEVYAHSKASRLQGQNPDCHYEYFSTDKEHPSYYEKKLVEHEVGSPAVGFAMAEAWQVVDAKTSGVKTGRPRDDQGKPLDTAIRHGDGVLLMTTKENKAVYDHMDRLKARLSEKQLRNGDVERTENGRAVVETRFGYGMTDHVEALGAPKEQ